MTTRKPTGIGRSAEERAKLLAEWETSRLTQAEYCRRQGIPITTFDYYRRQQLRQQAKAAADKQPGLVAVRVAAVAEASSSGSRGAAAARSFVLTLSNGRRIESGWDFQEAELARLVRVVEQV